MNSNLRRSCHSLGALLIGFLSFASPGALPDALAANTVSNCDLIDKGSDRQLQELITAGCKIIRTKANATISIRNSMAIPGDVKIIFESGSKWVIEESIEVLRQGAFEIPLVREVYFEGPGRIITESEHLGAFCPTSRTVAYPEWFGAIVNDDLDDSAAILKALEFGNDVRLDAGNYLLKKRLPLTKNQILSGLGISVSRLTQARNAEIVTYPDDPSSGESTDWSDILLQDFIVGLSSDCSGIRDLSIQGHELPDDLSSLSNVNQKLGTSPVISGIQISSHMGWKPGEEPVRNVVVKNVEVFRPHSNCINLQSDRAATDVLIDGVICNARGAHQNTSGLTIEAFHPTVANRFENVTIRNSVFNGGRWGLYVAGVTNLLIENSTIVPSENASSAALFYTSDNGHPTSAVIRNADFSLMNPGVSTKAVIELAARGYVKDRYNVFPFLREVGGSISFENTRIASSTFPQVNLIPLVLDTIGFRKPVRFYNTQFHGGRNAIMAGDPIKPTQFGSLVYFEDPVPGKPSLIRDLDESEIHEYELHHSNFVISLSRFYSQAGSAIRAHLSALQVTDTTFYNIGLSPDSLDLPIIDLGYPSPFSPMRNFFANNGYSGSHATAFLRLPREVLQNNTTWLTTNSPFEIQGSRPAITMESIRVY